MCSNCNFCEDKNCTNEFYNSFCFNYYNNTYSINESLFSTYDRISSSLKNDLSNNGLCGKSDIYGEIKSEEVYQFFSFSNPDYLKEHNILCHYTINNENIKSKEEITMEVDANMKEINKVNRVNGKNIILIIVEEITETRRDMYYIDLEEFSNKKINIKVAEYKSISLYVSLLGNNNNTSNEDLISLSLGVKKGADKMRKYKYTVIAFCILCILCVGICFIIYLIKYKRNRELYRLRAIQMANNQNAIGNHLDPNEKKIKLDKLYKTKLKKRKYSKKDNLNETTACSICLEEFEENKSDVSITPCLHIFHFNCLHNWLYSENSKCLCPYCNHDLLSDKPPTKRHKLEEKPIEKPMEKPLYKNKPPKINNKEEESSARVIKKHRNNKSSNNNNCEIKINNNETKDKNDINNEEDIDNQITNKNEDLKEKENKDNIESKIEINDDKENNNKATNKENNNIEAEKKDDNNNIDKE